jgi:DNA-binding CsgD family transcriptional regulator
MSTRELSPREAQIVELCVEGLTNEAIAQRLGISAGTVDSYWVRIKLKVGGSGKTDTVVKVIREKAERALRETNLERKGLADLIAEKEKGLLELRAALAVLQLAMDQIKSTVWATDKELSIQIIANGEFPSEHFGIKWEVGKTIYEIFATQDPEHPAVEAHLAAIGGETTEVRLPGNFANTILRTLPFLDESGEIMGCISILNSIGP